MKLSVAINELKNIHVSDEALHTVVNRTETLIDDLIELGEYGQPITMWLISKRLDAQNMIRARGLN